MANDIAELNRGMAEAEERNFDRLVSRTGLAPGQTYADGVRQPSILLKVLFGRIQRSHLWQSCLPGR